jgi:hypothetical protein
MQISLISSILFRLWVAASFSQGSVKNFYGIQEILMFNKINFKLSWSSHPLENYYKQEYVPPGQTVEHFNDMVLIDFLKQDISVDDVVQTEILSIEKRKKTDLVCNYQVIKNQSAGEFILDFVLSEGNGNTVKTIEWNAYRFKPYRDKSGHQGVLLFGISHRAYDNNASDFLKSLGSYRKEILMKLSAFSIPDIQIN